MENTSREKGRIISVLHDNLVHKFIPLPQAVKIPDAKAAVDKEWKKLETIPAWDVKKAKSKEEVIKEEQKNNNKVHFASLMDLCHLNNSELELQLQKYKGRVVPRGDIVKDDSGTYAVFIFQKRFISITQDGRKGNGCYCSTTQLCVHTGENGGCLKTTQF